MSTILILEDDPLLVRVYKAKLESAGIPVIFKENAVDILSVANSTKPSLVILDLIMPVKDGYYALKELKNNVDTKNIPIVVVSSLSSQDEKSRILDMGADYYFSKPDTNIHELIDFVQTLLPKQNL